MYRITIRKYDLYYSFPYIDNSYYESEEKALNAYESCVAHYKQSKQGYNKITVSLSIVEHNGKKPMKETKRLKFELI